MCGGNRDPTKRKKAKNKKEWCLPNHKKRSRCLGFLNLGFLEACFWFHIANIIISIKEKKAFGGCLSIVFARRTHDPALFFARYYIVSPLSLSSSSSSLAFLGATTTPTKGAILRLFLCCVIVCGVENSKRERERETYRKERHTHA